jgi:hypothetical protein
MKYIWSSRPVSHSVSPSIVTSVTPSTATSKINLNLSEKYPPPPSLRLDDAVVVATARTDTAQTKKEDPKKARPWKIFGWSWTTSRTPDADVEKGPSAPASRPIRLLAPFYGGVGAGLSICECLRAL